MNLLSHPELVDQLAGAYALGTLRGGARRRFETYVRQSPGLRAQVLLWQERFAAITELQPVQAPGPNVWKRIQNAIDAEAPASGVAPPAAGTAMLESLRRRLGFWRGGAIATALATLAAVFIAVDLDRALDRQGATLAQTGRARDQLAQQAAALNAQLQARPDIRYVAVLADDRQLPSVLVTFDPARSTLTVKRVAPFAEGADRSLQLWALPPGGAPRSLGVLDTDGVMRLSAPESQVREVPALAISLEPKGGAPAGSGPTGPVLFKGALLQTPT